MLTLDDEALFLILTHSSLVLSHLELEKLLLMHLLRPLPLHYIPLI